MIIIGGFFLVDIGIYLSSLYKSKDNRIKIIINSGNDFLEPLRQQEITKENIKIIARIELNEKL